MFTVIIYLYRCDVVEFSDVYGVRNFTFSRGKDKGWISFLGGVSLVSIIESVDYSSFLKFEHGNDFEPVNFGPTSSILGCINSFVT